jgi:hypothetical protein
MNYGETNAVKIEDQAFRQACHPSPVVSIQLAGGMPEPGIRKT